jgi:Asp-tRNA(Asn)/Glu-tRNA(Gln) amidotransferase C subunit
MSIPKQVQKQSEEVQELYKQINGTTEETQAAPAEVSNDVTVNNVEEPTTSDSVMEQAPQSEPKEQMESGDQEPKQADWQQKYKSLQGMYNADVPRLTSENRDLNSRVSQLENLLSTVDNAATQQSSAPSEKLITEDDEKEYGESIAVMRKAAREEVSQEIAQLRQQLGQIQSVVPQVHQVQAQQNKSNEQTFWNAIASEVPNWNDTNNDPDFQSWLLEIDPLTGINRQTYLEDAQRNLDANRVVSFFRTWEGANGRTNTAQVDRSIQQSQLQKQVAPGRSRNNGVKASGQSPTYTNSDIKDFFTDIRKGKYKGRDDERGRIERDIFAAQQEGRIVVA